MFYLFCISSSVLFFLELQCISTFLYLHMKNVAYISVYMPSNNQLLSLLLFLILATTSESLIEWELLLRYSDPQCLGENSGLLLVTLILRHKKWQILQSPGILFKSFAATATNSRELTQECKAMKGRTSGKRLGHTGPTDLQNLFRILKVMLYSLSAGNCRLRRLVDIPRANDQGGLQLPLRTPSAEVSSDGQNSHSDECIK